MSITAGRSLNYLRPRDVAEALELQASLPEARYLAGGTDLIVRLKERWETAGALISLGAIPELAAITVGGRPMHGADSNTNHLPVEATGARPLHGAGTGDASGRTGADDRAGPAGSGDSRGATVIGATATLADIAAQPAVRERHPLLVAAIGTMASQQIRNVATLGGNICRASPCADSAPALMALDARVRLLGSAGQRDLPLGAVFTGPGSTSLAPGELLMAVQLDPPAPGQRGVWLKQGRVRVDLAFASLAVVVELAPDGRTCARARLAAGAVAPTPVRLPGVEAWLAGRRLEPEVLARAAELTRDEVRPISDLRASADYRRHVMGVLCQRALAQLAGSGG